MIKDSGISMMDGWMKSGNKPFGQMKTMYYNTKKESNPSPSIVWEVEKLDQQILTTMSCLSVTLKNNCRFCHIFNTVVTC